MQYGKLRTDRGSWFINEFFVKLAYFNTHDTFKRNWSFRSPPAIESIESVERQERRDPLKYQKSWYMNQPKFPNRIKMRITNRCAETCIPTSTYQNGCKNSERLFWRKEFLNTETHTRVLLIVPIFRTYVKRGFGQAQYLYLLPEKTKLRDLPEDQNHEGPVQKTDWQSRSSCRKFWWFDHSRSQNC